MYHHGLERVSVEGLEPGATAQAETLLRQFGTLVRSPTSHRGAG